jgi:hypothetical protein
MCNEVHPCGSLAASFEIIILDFEIRKRDRNNECCLSPFSRKRAENMGIVRENPIPLKGVREADYAELPPTDGNSSRFLKGVKRVDSWTSLITHFYLEQ